MTAVTDFEFNPFLDYSKISPEMVQDMYAAVREHRAAADDLLTSPSPGAVERLLKAQDNISDIVSAIESAILTVPVMVHVAGEAEDEHETMDDEDSNIIKVQRCKRCKSPLIGWRPGLMNMTTEGPQPLEPDDVKWWAEGAQVAKAQFGNSLTQYIIEDRQLERHERECVGIPNL